MLPQHLAPIQVSPTGIPEGDFALPALPAVVGKILDSIQSGDATAGEIADLLAADPALAAKVLKIVNSAYYGLPRPIAEVRHAVAYLGLSEIQRLALTATVMQEFAVDGDDYDQFWRHSFYTALVSKLLARTMPTSFESGSVHTAALLHDVGKLVYMRFWPEHYSELTRSCRASGTMLVEAERELNLPSHVALGSLLCERWRLPTGIRIACEHHELSDLSDLDDDAELRDEILIVGLANLLTNLAAGDLAPETNGAINELAVRALGYDEEQFLLLMGQVYELQLEVDAFLGQL